MKGEKICSFLLFVCLVLANQLYITVIRLLVAKELSNTIYEISVSEAVNYVLPMVLKICTDPDDTVRETIISEFDKIMMYYYTVSIL